MSTARPRASRAGYRARGVGIRRAAARTGTPGILPRPGIADQTGRYGHIRGIVLCEDTATGEIFPFAQNTVALPEDGLAGSTLRAGRYTGSEWCGSTFEPKNGNWLFANAQTPGITFAITGPWRKCAL